jgi:hypothetical protein
MWHHVGLYILSFYTVFFSKFLIYFLFFSYLVWIQCDTWIFLYDIERLCFLFIELNVYMHLFITLITWGVIGCHSKERIIIRFTRKFKHTMWWPMGSMWFLCWNILNYLAVLNSLASSVKMRTCLANLKLYLILKCNLRVSTQPLETASSKIIWEKKLV